ncbi:MAG: L,D-transpeptidase, partial [Mucilaginibacter sp.]|nr:L,D-transpeptidase [Mucilaginibacter sp.]
MFPRIANKALSLRPLISMIKFAPVKKIAVPLLILSAFIITFQSCKKKRNETATFFFKKTHNKIYQDYTPEAFAKVFKSELVRERSNLKHADFITDYYIKNHYTPQLVMAHLFNGDLLTIASYCFKADEHGLNPKIFQADRLRTLIYEFARRKNTKSIDSAYREIAKIELTAANSLINYSNAMEYGVISPKLIYQRYFLATKRPDSLGMLRVFHVGDMRAYLDSIQPKSPQYLALQKALSEKYEAPGRSGEET